MKKADKLHILIKSLKKSEKRQFKIIGSKYSGTQGSNYTRLFDIIDQQTEYDDQVTRDKLASLGVTSPLSVLKINLYNLILDSLQSQQKSIESQVKSLISDIEILAGRNLHGLCMPLIEKGKKLAGDAELLLPTLELLTWERRIAQNSGNYTEDLKNSLEDKKLEILKVYRNRCDMKFLARMLLLWSRKTQVIQSTEDLVPFDELISNPIFSNPDNCLSIIAKFDFYNSWALYYRTINNATKLVEMRSQGVKLLDENPSYRNYHQETYFVAVNNLIYAHINNGEYLKARELLPNLYQMDPVSEDLYNLVHSSAKNLDMAICFHLGEFSKGVSMLEQFIEQTGPLENKMIPNQKAPYFFYNSLLYFGAGEYRKCLFWLNRVMDSREEGYRQDVHRLAMILNLLVHYELGNLEQLDYYIKSTYRALYKRQEVYQTEKLIFSFLKQLARVSNDLNFKNLLAEFREEVSKISEDKFERRMLDYIDLSSWADAKITGVPFKDVKRRKIVFK